MASRFTRWMSRYQPWKTSRGNQSSFKLVQELSQRKGLTLRQWANASAVTISEVPQIGRRISHNEYFEPLYEGADLNVRIPTRLRAFIRRQVKTLQTLMDEHFAALCP
jgi:hypothetical protein